MQNDSSRAESFPYTAKTLEQFLHWKEYKITGALDALALIERSILTPDDFAGLTSRQAEALAHETLRIHKETGDTKRTKKTGKALASGLKTTSGTRTDKRGSENARKDVTIHNIRDKANEEAGLRGAGKYSHLKKENRLPTIEKFSESLTKRLAAVFTDDSEKWDMIAQCSKDIPGPTRKMLLGALRGLVKRAEKCIAQLEVK